MAETFKLPCSSYEELIKLFQAYANTKEGTALSLDEITQATGVPRTIVSNYSFLCDPFRLAQCWRSSLSADNVQ